MRVFKTKWFARFTKREKITDKSLCEAIKRAERGLIDADLGGGLIKQRVARPGKGKSGGYRVIIAYRFKQKAIFLFGFAKSEKENISSDELVFLQELGTNWLAANAEKIRTETDAGNIQEVEYEEKA